MSSRWSTAAVLSLIVCASGGWLLQRHLGARTEVGRRGLVFEAVLVRVRDAHVDSLPEDSLYRHAIDGVLGQLHDPYAALLTGREYRRLVERTTGDYAGIGVQVDARNGSLAVIAPLPGSPGERAGMRSGDQIVEISGTLAEGWTLERAVEALRGPTGTADVVHPERPFDPGTAPGLRDGVSAHRCKER